MNDVILNKKESIERCIMQIRKYYSLPSDKKFELDFLKQDAIALNLLRASQQAIDLANHVIKINKLGLPKESKESFQILYKNGVIPKDLSEKLGKMVGFRNVLVHEYQKLDLQLLVDIIKHHLDDLLDFTNLILKHDGNDGNPR